MPTPKDTNKLDLARAASRAKFEADALAIKWAEMRLKHLEKGLAKIIEMAPYTTRDEIKTYAREVLNV